MKKSGILIALISLFALGASSDDVERDAEFVFARLQFNMSMNALLDREPPWRHDYPFSEDFYLGVLQEVTGIHTSRDAYQIVQLNSNDIFRYPFLYVSEPGFMELTDPETRNLREYLDRGGFLMFDDFRGRDLDQLRFQMKKVYPDREMFRLDIRHPIFDSLYSIDSLDMTPPYVDFRFEGRGPEFWGMEDERGRLIMIANQNNDFGELWEWVDRGEMPLQPAAQSVRMGVNYLVYAMTH